MPEQKRGRPIQTPDLDRVIDALNAGKYDDRILDVHEALQGRREVLQEQLRARVREVFGPDADVVIKKAEPESTPTVDGKKNAFIAKAERYIRPDGQLPGPYKTNPDDGNSYRMDEDFTNGMLSITDMFGGHQHSIPKAEWDLWPDRIPDSGVDDGVVNQTTNPDEVPIENRGPIIGGMSASDFGN